MLVFFMIPHVLCAFFIQYLAFSGTNLLTRCHSASSCFLLFLYFRKVVQEIFSELHGTNFQYPISCNEARARRGPEGRQPGGQTRLALSRAWGLSGPPRAPPTPPLRPYILR